MAPKHLVVAYCKLTEDYLPRLNEDSIKDKLDPVSSDYIPMKVSKNPKNIQTMTASDKKVFHSWLFN